MAPINGTSTATSDTPECKHPDLVTQAELGFKTGADKYEKGRPNYTPATVDYVSSTITGVSRSEQTEDISIRYNVVELGAGTGKMTEVLRKKLPADTHYLVLEPSREFLDTLASKNLGVDHVCGAASSIPADDASVENVVCAQSFHYFADHKHLKEIRRVLVPGGNLMIVMNLKDFDHEWMKEIYKQRLQVFARTGGSTKYLASSMEWKRDLKESELFSLKEHKSLPGVEFRGDIEKIVHHFTTVSVYNMLPKEELDVYLDEMRNVLTSWPGLDPNDIQIPFSSEIYTYTAI